MFSKNSERLKGMFNKPNSTWAYSVFGQIISINPVMVDCDITVFDLGQLSRDERIIGEYVFFDIKRLDISEYISE